MWTLGVIQYGFYWGIVLRLYHKHTLVIESEFSNTEGKTLSWMKSFVHIFGLCFCILVITIPFAVHSAYSLVVTTANCILSITIFILGYEGLFQEEVFFRMQRHCNLCLPYQPRSKTPANHGRLQRKSKSLYPNS